MTLPPLLQTYFSDRDVNRLADCFASDAKVRDEGEDISGLAEIRAWLEKVEEKYHPTARPLRHWQQDGHDFVTARVEGTFPGSPIELTYRFGLRDQKIATFEVVS